MKTLVRHIPVDFDAAPQLAKVPPGQMAEYWLENDGKLIQHRLYSRCTIIHDLYEVLGKIKSPNNVKVYLQAPKNLPHDLQHVISENVGKYGKHIWKALCKYDTILGGPIAMYPSLEICAQETGHQPRLIQACLRGDSAIIGESTVIFRGYMTDEELAFRSTVRNRLGRHPLRIYVYDSLGDFVGSFATLSDAAVLLGMDYKTLHKGLMVKHRSVKGYYVYTDPNTKPPINIDTSYDRD